MQIFGDDDSRGEPGADMKGQRQRRDQ
jgi:hypothetical protein